MLRPRNQLTLLTATILFFCVRLSAQSEVTLTRCWQYPVDDVIALTAKENAVFAAVEGGRVLALSSSGEKLWETDLGGQIEPYVALAGDGLLVSTQSGAEPSVRRLSLETGLPMNGSTEAETIAKVRDANLNIPARLGTATVSGDEYGVVSANGADEIGRAHV